MIVAVLEVEVEDNFSVITVVAVFRVRKVLSLCAFREVVLVEHLSLAIGLNFLLGELIDRYCQLILDLPL